MTRTLRKGTRGPDVGRWQRFLTAQGHLNGELDGVFGERTKQATVAFQSARGLKADGVVGPKTLAEATKHGFRSVRRLTNGELTPSLIAHARAVLAKHHDKPFGSEFPFELESILYVARIEEHYHPPGGPRKPWGHHVGVSLFLDSAPDTTIVAPDDVTEPPGPPRADDDTPSLITTRGTIVLDPGHGGAARAGASSANNATSPSGVLEKEVTLRLARLVRDSIAERATAVRVELTRNSDTNLDLVDRARTARDLKADLFLSIHFNGADGTARGVETLVRPKASGNVNYDSDRAFAERVQSAVFGAVRFFDPGTKNRGVKDQTLGVLRDDFLGNSVTHHPCRACLLEVEFLDVPEVDRLFNTGVEADRVCQTVADAIATALLSELETR